MEKSTNIKICKYQELCKTIISLYENLQLVNGLLDDDKIKFKISIGSDNNLFCEPYVKKCTTSDNNNDMLPYICTIDDLSKPILYFLNHNLEKSNKRSWISMTNIIDGFIKWYYDSFRTKIEFDQELYLKFYDIIRGLGIKFSNLRLYGYSLKNTE